MVLSVDQILGFIFGPFGTLFLVLFIIYTGYKKMWVFGWYAQELSNRNQRLENRIDKVSAAAQSVTAVAETAAALAEKNAEAANE